MPSAENCIACRFHQEIDQGAQNALAFCPLKTRNTVQSKRLLLVDSLFIISEAFSFVKNFFKTFFEVFWSISFKTQTFLTAVSFETAYLVYQTQNHLSRTFFLSFQIFWTWPPRLSATALIEYHRDSPPVNNFFSFFCNLLQLCKKAPLLEPFYYCANRLYIRSMVTMACSPV